MDVSTHRRSDMGIELAEEICSLWLEVWPKPDRPAPDLREAARRLVAGHAVRQTMVEGSERFHVIEGEGTVLAVCRTFEREIRFLEMGTKRTVLALAGVCSHPRARGRSLGKSVVASALERLDCRVPCCLFQTGVPGFYEKFGAYFVENVFVNSESGENPSANPWWDRCVMAIGDRENWPTGRVDLLGAAY